MIRKEKVPTTSDPLFIKRVADTTPDIIYVMDLFSYVIIYHNRKIAFLLGYSTEEIDKFENPVLDIMHEEDKPAMLLHLHNMKAARDDEVREIEYRMMHANGSICWFRDRDSVFRRDENGMVREKIGVAQDISFAKSVRQEITKHHIFQKQYEQMAQSGNWEYDIDSSRFQWSEGMYELFDIKKQSDVRPQVYVDYAVHDDIELAVKIAKNIQRSFQPFEEVLRIKIREGVKAVRVKGEPMFDEKGTAMKMVGIDIDVTRAMEAADRINKLNLALTAKNRELGSLNAEIKTFTSIAAVNYRVPLSTLYTSIEYIIKNDASRLSDSSKANLRKSQSAIQKMKLITEDLINYFGIGMKYGNVGNVNVNQLLKSVLTGLSHKIENANAKIQVAELPAVRGVLSLILLLFQYLIDNAVKFRRDDVPPVIHISSYTAAGKEIGPVAVQDSLYTAIAICDNGIGFSSEDKDKLFTLFSKLNDKGKYRGSGIGLAVCKKIMEIHKGYIRAEGVPESGATFTVYFPQ